MDTTYINVSAMSDTCLILKSEDVGAIKGIKLNLTLILS